MNKIRRREFVTHIQHMIADIGDLSAMTHGKVVEFLNQEQVQVGFSQVFAHRYAAALLSYARGHTTDEDVVWRWSIN